MGGNIIDNKNSGVAVRIRESFKNIVNFKPFKIYH